MVVVILGMAMEKCIGKSSIIFVWLYNSMKLNYFVMLAPLQQVWKDEPSAHYTESFLHFEK